MHPHKASTVTLGISTKDGTVRAAFSDQAILHAIRQALRMCMEEAEYQGGVHETQIMQRRQEEEDARRTA